jgi:hypothetical protein
MHFSRLWAHQPPFVLEVVHGALLGCKVEQVTLQLAESGVVTCEGCDGGLPHALVSRSEYVGRIAYCFHCGNGGPDVQDIEIILPSLLPSRRGPAFGKRRGQHHDHNGGEARSQNLKGSTAQPPLSPRGLQWHDCEPKPSLRKVLRLCLRRFDPNRPRPYSQMELIMASLGPVIYMKVTCITQVYSYSQLQVLEYHPLIGSAVSHGRRWSLIPSCRFNVLTSDSGHRLAAFYYVLALTLRLTSAQSQAGRSQICSAFSRKFVDWRVIAFSLLRSFSAIRLLLIVS